MTLSPKTLARIAELDKHHRRCQWFGPRGQCTRLGNNWRIDKGRYCDTHAERMGWILL